MLILFFSLLSTHLMELEMNLTEKIKHRFSRETFQKIIAYRKMMNESNSELKNHINHYYKRFLLPLIFGSRFYKHITPYGINMRRIEEKFLRLNQSDLDLTAIYRNSDNICKIMEINKSNKYNEFELHDLKFHLNENKYIQNLILGELMDLVIPYLTKNNLIYNRTLFGEGTYESENVFVSPGDVVFDVGANIGMFTVFSLLKKNAKHVYAFEPVKSTHEILRNNCKLNKILKNVGLINKGLANKRGFFEISISNSNIGANSIIFNRNDNSESVSITTLDYFVESQSIRKIDFIKVDIEGAERLFLEGAKKTLANFKPKLSICTYHLIDDPVVLTKLILQANPNYKIEYFSKKLYAW